MPRHYSWKDLVNGTVSQKVYPSKGELFEASGFGAVHMEKPIKGFLAVRVVKENNKWVEVIAEVSLKESKWEVRKCATLGTHWRDVYRDDVLFMREVETKTAEEFVANPTMFNFPFVDIPKMRTLMLEKEIQYTEGAGHVEEE